jgi:hypothetical protein
VYLGTCTLLLLLGHVADVETSFYPRSCSEFFNGTLFRPHGTRRSRFTGMKYTLEPTKDAGCQVRGCADVRKGLEEDRNKLF